MSSSTAIADSWIHMQQGDANQHRSLPYTKMPGDERYSKPTASSRSRAATNRSALDEPPLSSRKSIKELRRTLEDDVGMSRDGIYQAFAQVEESLNQTAIKNAARRTVTDDDGPATLAGSPARRKSVAEATARLQRKSCVEDETKPTNRTRASTLGTVARLTAQPDSPRANPLTTKKSTENMALARRRTLSGADHQASPRVQPTSTRARQYSMGDEQGWQSLESDTTVTDDLYRDRTAAENPYKTPGTKATRLSKAAPPEREAGSSNVIRLADAFRDSLLVERKLARQDLGLAVAKRETEKTRKRVSKPSAVTATAAAEQRRPSLRAESPPTVRTTAEIISDAKRRLSLGKDKIRDLERAATASRPATSAAQGPRRRTQSGGSTLKAGLEERRKSVASRGTPTGIPEYMKPTLADIRRRSVANTDDHEESTASLTTKRRSTLASSSRASRRDTGSSSRASSVSSDHQPSSVLDDDKSSVTATCRPQGSRRSSDELSEQLTRRQRKKSIVAMDDSTINTRRARRMSRTESLKEGVPTSPSLNAALAWRKKNQANQEATAKRLSKEAKPTTTTITVRKRGKTLPGSLASPPPVQTLNLPPMKVEPIKLTIPRSSMQRKSSTATTPSRSPQPKPVTSVTPRATSPSTASGTSSEGETTKPTQPRKKTDLSHLGIAPGRRASLKTPRITPASPKETAVSTTASAAGSSAASATASPRTRPLYTRRPSASSARKLSLSIANTKSGLYSEDVSPSIGPITAGATSRTRKASVNSINTASRASSLQAGSRKNSMVSVPDQEPTAAEKERLRAMSLQERLQAMVAQHAIKDDYAASDFPMFRERRVRHNLTLDIDDLTVDDRSRFEGSAWEKDIYDIASGGIRGPKSPTTAIKYYSAYLSPYERNEIREYPQVYFIGHHAQKNQATPENSTCNYGYDDERGDYNIVIQDHLAYRYEVLDVLGQGSFGQVVKCFDHKTGQTVAIKMIRNKKRFHAQALTEVKILKNLVEWDPHDQHHNIRMTDYFYFRNHLCIACECLSMNLYEFIKGNDFRGFSLSLIRRFTIQLLQSLCLLYERGVVHCDLKPENILLKHPTKSTIKVIDFGSSCFESERVYTYIQSRFYRSPEIILGMNYNMAIDMWSLGCILAELYTGIPLFPGENEQEQLACIMEILGVPSRYLIDQSARKKLFFDSSCNPRIIPNSRGKKRRPGSKTLSQALRCHDTLFLDFVERCLLWDPSKRMKPDEALCHDWITQNTRSVVGAKTKDTPTTPAEAQPTALEEPKTATDHEKIL